MNVKELYFQSFPECERRPWNKLQENLSSGLCKLIIIEDAGFMILWDFDSWCYVEYLAISPQMRGRGKGSQALASISKPVVLEIEPPATSTEALKRAAFYRRAGFRAHEEYDYIQPPYAPGLPEVKMVLTTRGEVPDLDEIKEKLYREVYGKR